MIFYVSLTLVLVVSTAICHRLKLEKKAIAIQWLNFTSNLFTWIYSGGGGLKFMAHFKGGGGARYKSLGTSAQERWITLCSSEWDTQTITEEITEYAKDMAVAYFKILSRYYPESTEKKTKYVLLYSKHIIVPPKQATHRSFTSMLHCPVYAF